jgi:uncharacterized membrane protein YjdF
LNALALTLFWRPLSIYILNYFQNFAKIGVEWVTKSVAEWVSLARFNCIDMSSWL